MLHNNIVCNINEIPAAEKRVLNNILTAIDLGSYAHSYIIEGGSGVARFRCAVYIACAVVCENKQSTDGIKMPCFSCPQCRKILEDEHSDIKILGGGDSFKGDIKVDDIRELRKEAYVVPSECDHHVYILRESDRMNKNAQNALLKILEEPPENTMFLLLTASKELLIPTVVSRAQAHTLGKSSLEEMTRALAAKFGNIPPETLRRAARLQSVMDKTELDMAAVKSLDSAFDVVKKYFVEKQYRINEDLPKNKDELLLTLSVLAVAARDVAVSKKSEAAELFIFERGAELETAKSGVTVRRAVELYEAFSRAAERVAASGNVSSIQAELFAAVKK